MDKERDGFPLTAIREVNILLSFHHAAIVDVSEVGLNTLCTVFRCAKHTAYCLHRNPSSKLLCAG
jgi:hypothetical protein